MIIVPACMSEIGFADWQATHLYTGICGRALR